MLTQVLPLFSSLTRLDLRGCKNLTLLTRELIGKSADVCSRMLTYAHVCSRMLTLLTRGRIDKYCKGMRELVC
jgi:hypothetical protein